MIGVVDYGVGNFGSILHMLRRARIEANIVSNVSAIQECDRLIFPGMGAFDTGMIKIRESGFIPILEEKIFDEKCPVLGICLGMQMFANSSEEGDESGLGWIDADNIRFSFQPFKYYKIPHIGWNTLKINFEHPLINGISEDDLFYFAHSFHLDQALKEIVLAETDYVYDFPAVVCDGNVFGVQFHPERSHDCGIVILENFSEI